MVKSMTGFGRSEYLDENVRIAAEIKSVNHRYLEPGIRMPRRLNSFEAEIRNWVKTIASRGKVDLFITCESFENDSEEVRYNASLAEGYYGFMQEMSEKLGIENDITVSKLASFPDIFTIEKKDEDMDELWPLIRKTLEEAGAQFVAQREVEGERLKKDILGKLAGMEKEVAAIEALSPEIVKEYRNKLTERMREVLEGTPVDEARLLTEAAVFADKTCVDEETVRLSSHIKSMRNTLETGDSQGIGRKLDFIAQEMNREANTILSKCNNMDISATAIHLKGEIEKIREQVQNIE